MNPSIRPLASCKDFRDLTHGLFFATSQGLDIGGIFRLRARANAIVSHLIDALKFLLNAFGQLKGIGLVAQPLKFFGLGPIRLGGA